MTDGVPFPSLGDPGVLRAVVLSGAYLTRSALSGWDSVLHPALRGGDRRAGGLSFVLPTISRG